MREAEFTTIDVLIIWHHIPDRPHFRNYIFYSSKEDYDRHYFHSLIQTMFLCVFFMVIIFHSMDDSQAHIISINHMTASRNNELRQCESRVLLAFTTHLPYWAIIWELENSERRRKKKMLIRSQSQLPYI